MNMMHAVAQMIASTARDWSVPEMSAEPLPPQPIPSAKGGSVKRNQRAAAKTKARRRARRLNHF